MTQKILFVDDEKSMLSALQRLFIDSDYEIFTAEGGYPAIELLKKHEVDLIVSDQKMPEIEGTEFLVKSKEYAPDAVRMILTGYADLEAAIDSVNKAEIYRYITKPWNNEELKSIVHDALELKRLKKENLNLLQLTKDQNIELKELNANLEAKVSAQTKKLRNLIDKLRLLNCQINKSFTNTLEVLLNIVNAKEKTVALRFKNRSKLTMAIASQLSLGENELRQIEFASLLCDIGLIGIDDTLLNKPFDNMTSTERTEYMEHTILGQAAIDIIENLNDAGVIIRHHHELWDGDGYPDNLSGKNIPVGSRIISIASDYDALMNGLFMPSCYSSKEARQFIIENSDKLYDTEIVAVFANVIQLAEKDLEEKPEYKISSSVLKPGMVLTKDVVTSKGLLLMHEGVVVNDKHVKNIIQFEKSEGKRYTIYVIPNANNIL